MDVLFPSDLKGVDKQENPKVASFLVKEFPKEYQQGAPDEGVQDSIRRLLTYMDEITPWMVVYGKELAPPDLFELAKWLAISFACTKEQRAVLVSYTELVEAIKHSTEIAEHAKRTPFLILMFPELVFHADWARAKFLDMIIQKKNVVIFTTNPQGMDLVFGDVLVKTIRSFTGTDVVTF